MKSNESLSRRGLMMTALTAPVALAQQAPAPAPDPDPNTDTQRRGTMAERAPFGETIEFRRQDMPLKIKPFPMTAVKLGAGPCADAEQWNHGYVSRLEAGRLLHNFRVNAGLSSSAKPFGGWEEPKCELRGHFTGHYLSSAALVWAGSGDAKAKAKGEEIVAGLAECQAKLEGGYLSAFPLEFMDRVAARKKVWAPFYTLHKIMAGLLDMYEHAGSKQALEVLLKFSDWTDRWSGSKTEKHMQDILNTEYGGMNDILYKLAVVTNDAKWVAVGDRFTKKKFFNPLGLHQDQLRGLHVNTHIPQVIGAAKRWEISGDERFRRVAEFFWETVVSGRCYCTTGTSNGEGWLTQVGLLNEELPRSVATAECCCSYNMLKLARHLYSWTGDARYFEYYERALWNHRLGTIQPKTGYTQYYLSHTGGAWKTFNTEDQSFWCCTGTGVEEYAKLNDSIYWQDREGVIVNLFVASELDWKEKGLQLKMETAFPRQEQVRITVTGKAARFALKIRVPAWLESAPLVKLNGRPLESSAAPGSYLTLTRTWQANDRLEFDLPMKLTTEGLPGDPRQRAVLYGPLVLAGDLGTVGLKPELITGPSAPELGWEAEQKTRVAPVEVPAFESKGANVDAWVEKTGPLQFRTKGQKANVDLKPLNEIFDRRYAIYWKLS